jgi:hypothetical protein
MHEKKCEDVVEPAVLNLWIFVGAISFQRHGEQILYVSC